MATDYNKSGSGRFTSKNKFTGRTAAGDSAGKPAFKGKTAPYSGEKKVFNRSERFDRDNRFGPNREDQGNPAQRGKARFGGFKSGPKFNKPAPFTGNGRFPKDNDASSGRDRRTAETTNPREDDSRPVRPYQANRNFSTENRYRPSPFGAVPKGRPGERNRSFKPEKEAYRQNLQAQGNSHEDRFPDRKPFNRDRPADTAGQPAPRRFDRGESFGERRSEPTQDRESGRSDRNPAGRRTAKPFDRTRSGDRKAPGRGREARTDERPFGRGFGRAETNERQSFGRDREAGNPDRPSFDRARREETRPGRREFDRKPHSPKDHPAAGRLPSRRNTDERPREAPDYDLRRYNSREQPKNAHEGRQTEGIRLNRYIANAGICSRREADTLIVAGEIKVNGEIVTEMGYIVKPSDTVQYGKKKLNREKMVYVLLNKPKDFITTTDDPEGRKTVMDLIANASKERLFPVGRLDRNTTGLLLFTNDGELAQKLMHPSHKNSKIYQVELDKPITKEDFAKIQAGLELEDGKVEVDDLALVGDKGTFLGIEIHIGKNRVVRRIFEHLGYEVVSLDRVQYAGLTKKDLPRGKWRFLNEKEVIRLKYFL